ncbi:MAG: hypothetical protein D6729_03675, partial [Deltaproteobacteria bacterium]
MIRRAPGEVTAGAGPPKTGTAAESVDFRSPLSRVLWILLPLSLAASTAGAVGALRSRPDGWAGLALGGLFGVAALAFAATRRRFVADPERDLWVLWTGLLGRRTGTRSELAGVSLRPATLPDARLVDAPHHLVELRPKAGEPLLLFESEDAAQARAQAVRLARTLRLPLSEAGSGGPVEHSPAALDAEIARRLAAGPTSLDPPAGCDLQGPVLRLPKARPAAAQIAFAGGAASLFTFVVALTVAAFHRRSGAGLGFLAYGLPLASLFFFGTVAAVGRLVARPSISVTPSGLWLERHLFGRRIGGRHLPFEEIEAMEVDGTGLRIVSRS